MISSNKTAPFSVSFTALKGDYGILRGFQLNLLKKAGGIAQVTAMSNGVPEITRPDDEGYPHFSVRVFPSSPESPNFHYSQFYSIFYAPSAVKYPQEVALVLLERPRRHFIQSRF